MKRYWRLRAMLRYGVLHRPPTEKQITGLASLGLSLKARRCKICGDEFWALRNAEVCADIDCYIQHKRGAKQ